MSDLHPPQMEPMVLGAAGEPPHATNDSPDAPTSPYAGRTLSRAEHIKISAYWFATNMLWGALLAIMLPKEIKVLAPYFRIPALSILTGAAALVALVVPLVVGAMSDRCTNSLGRRRPFMIVGVGINLVGLALMAAVFLSATPIPGRTQDLKASFFQAVPILFGSPSFVFFLLAYMVVQLGNNTASAAYSGVIPDLVPHDQRGTASGYMALMSQLGTLVGAIVSGAVLGGKPVVVQYSVLGVALVAVGLVTILGIKETPLIRKPPKIDFKEYVRSLWIDPKKYPDFAWVWITRALVMMGFYAVAPFLNFFLIDVIGIEKPDKQASLLIAIILLTSSFSGYFGGWVSDRIGRKRVVYLANMMMAVMSLAFIFCHDIEQVILVGVFFGVGFGAYTSVDWALGTDVLPSETEAAKEMGVWHIAMTLPQAIAGPMAGIVIAAFGSRMLIQSGDLVIHYTLAGYAVVFVICSVFFALGGFFLRNVRGVN